MNTHDSQYFLRHLLREHEALDEELAIVRRSLQRDLLGDAAASARKKALLRISGLRNRLASHFEEEECEGCLEEAVSRRPALAHEAMAIVAEHRGLVAELDRLIERLDEKASPREIASVEADFEAFAQRLVEHERREQQAVKSGLNIEE